MAPDFATGLGARGAAPALLCSDGRSLSYAALEAAVAARAARLPGPGGLVAIAATPTPETVVAYLAALRAGCAVAMLDPDDAAGLAGFRARFEPDLCLGPDGARDGPPVPAPERPVHPDLALLLMTSGSTGQARAVRLSSTAVAANAAAIADYLGLTPQDRGALILPLCYSYGLSVLNSHLAAGASLLLDAGPVLDPDFIARLRATRCTGLAGVPYSFELLEGIDFRAAALPDLRCLTVAGGRMAPDLVRTYAAHMAARGGRFFAMYGQTEATARMCVLDPAEAGEHPDSVGRPVPGGWFSIDRTATEIPDIAGVSAAGELVYHGPNVMLGYATRRDELAAGREIDALRTGDLGYLDAGGRVRIVGRRSGFAKVLGKRIDLQQTEDGLARADLRACVLAGDEQLRVAVETDDPISETGVRERTAALTGLPTSAVRVLGMRSLPLLSTGKLDREAVRRAFEQIDAADRERAADRAVDDDRNIVDIDRIRRIFESCLGRGDVRDDDSFVSLRGDSLSYVELSVRLEAALGELPDDWQDRTIGELAAINRSRSRWASVESSIVLRVMATVTVLGTHVGIFTFLGGAHALLALVGFNLARFSMAAPTPRERARRLGGVLATVGIPTFLLVAIVHLLNGQYTLANLLQVRWIFGPFDWGPHAQLWFIEAALWSVILLLGLLAIPAVSRWYDAHPFWVALAALPVALIPRYFFLEGITSPVRGLLPWVFWLVLIGIAVAHAETVRQRLLVSLITIATIAGFFGSLQREAYIAGAILVLIWVPRIRLPRFLALAAAPIAGASLYIYLVQWQVFGHFQSAVLGFLASIAAGLAVWLVVRAVRRPLLRITPPIGINPR